MHKRSVTVPSWGILKSSKKKSRSANKVRFSTDGPARKGDTSNSSNSLESDASSEDACSREGPGHTHDPHHQDLASPGRVPHADISHEDIEDEEERRCLRHLDQLGQALENTYKEVEIIDAYVRKLRYDFDHEMVPEKRYMSCMCSAKIARTACCKKQIEVWQRLQHDIQETCCHHHPHCPDSLNRHHHHLHHHHQCSGEISSMTEVDSSLSDSSDTISISTTGSQDYTSGADTMDVVLYHVHKMVLFNAVRQRLDPSTDSRTFVEHWILSGQHVDSGDGDYHAHGADDSHHAEAL